MAIIDPAIVKVLVETQLQTVSPSVIATGSILFPGDPEPDGLERWIRLVAIDLMPTGDRPRSASYSGATQDEPDHNDVVVTINCACSVSVMKSHPGALASVLAEVMKVMSQATMRDASTNHQLDIFEARPSMDRELDIQRRSASGMVICEGTVCRTSGSTMTPFVS